MKGLCYCVLPFSATSVINVWSKQQVWLVTFTKHKNSGMYIHKYTFADEELFPRPNSWRWPGPCYRLNGLTCNWRGYLYTLYIYMVCVHKACEKYTATQGERWPEIVCNVSSFNKKHLTYIHLKHLQSVASDQKNNTLRNRICLIKKDQQIRPMSGGIHIIWGETNVIVKPTLTAGQDIDLNNPHSRVEQRSTMAFGHHRGVFHEQSC